MTRCDGLAAAFLCAADVLKGEHTWELRISRVKPIDARIDAP